jgi:beta-lactamase class A
MDTISRLNIFRLIFSWIPILLLVQISFGQQTDKKLQKEIELICQSFKGDVGVYVKNLKTNKIVSINADTVFPTASMVKIPILLGITKRINEGAFGYHESITYKDSLLYEGVDILGSFKNGEKIEISKLIMLMMTMSDNTASLWLQSLAGGGLAVNELLDQYGFTHTRINSRTTGRENNRTVYGWGQTSPKEMATLVERMYKKEFLNEEANERMLRSLKRNYWDSEALSQIPPNVNVFSKNGAVNKSRSEVVLVNAPHGDYVVCVNTKNNEDQSWQRSNEAWEMIRKISLTIWKHYEKKSNWNPNTKNPEKWF